MLFHEISHKLSEILRRQFPQIMEQLGWVVADCVWVHGKGGYACLALADSWITGSRKPTSEHIATLREFFGIGKEDIVALADNEPMWWMDLNSHDWHYRHKRDELKKYRPWDLRRGDSKAPN